MDLEWQHLARLFRKSIRFISSLRGFAESKAAETLPSLEDGSNRAQRSPCSDRVAACSMIAKRAKSVPVRDFILPKRRSKERAQRDRESDDLRPIRDRRKSSPSFVRSDAEWRILTRIASLFDEEQEALALLTKNLKDGHIRTPDRAVPLREFLRTHQDAWQKRHESGAHHTVRILERSLVNLASSNQCASPSSRLANLDEIERRRDIDGQYEGKYGVFPRD